MTWKDFPALSPMTDAMRIHGLEHDVISLKDDVRKLRDDLRGLRGLSFGWCVRDLMVCAGEIWMWLVKKRGEESGDGKQLYDPACLHLVVRAATAMGMANQIAEVQQMSRKCILARNDAAHFSSLEVLEDAVRSCEKGMQVFPTLRESYPDQCMTVEHYWRMKQLLSDSFKDT